MKILSVNKDSFLSFQSGYVLLLYSCLITLVRTSSTVLSRTSESRHPSLVFILRASIQPFIIKYDVAAAVAAAKSLQSCPTLCDPIDGQPTRLPRPWDSPGKNTGVGCHSLLPCMKVKSESEVAQSCPTLSDPMDCSLTGSSVHGIFQEYWSGVP